MTTVQALTANLGRCSPKAGPAARVDDWPRDPWLRAFDLLFLHECPELAGRFLTCGA